ncbi:MAG TPA: hypothetical protein ENH87_11090 [Pricia antarctica]|uniref:Uncharacterized protein n=1 Tax=Pricia antarctica TaxID=641691 RepID=A0A831VRZ1_9FLAO|nr:hypothetical protein [Pricia antarctica]
MRIEPVCHSCKTALDRFNQSATDIVGAIASIQVWACRNPSCVRFLLIVIPEQRIIVDEDVEKKGH